jgi:hypothetical protein
MIASGSHERAIVANVVCRLSVWVSFLAILDAQRAAIDWSVPSIVAPRDRRAILEIARRVGITNPRSVWTPVASTCTLVEVESTPIVDGNRVRSSVVGVRRLRGPECLSPGAGRRLVQQGNWVAFLGDFNPRHRERWRVRDGLWHIDISIGSDVPYDDPVSIVLGIRRRQLVDRRPPTVGAPSPMRYVDPTEIFDIRTDSDRQATPVFYRVMTVAQGGGGGEYLHVRVQDDTVELLQHGFWMT